MGDERLRFSDRYAKLQGEYRSKLPERMKHIDDAWEALRGGSWDAGKFSDFYRFVHNLVGTGRSFGFGGLSDVAGQLDRILSGFLSGRDRPTPEQQQAVESGLQALRNEVQKAMMAEKLTEPTQPTSPEAAVRMDRGRRTVCFIGHNAASVQELAQQVGHFGHAVRVFDSIGACRAAVGDDLPSMIVLDGPEGDHPLTREALKEAAAWTASVPLIVLSSDNTVRARLEAVRAGAKAYLTRPVDIQELVDAIDGLKPQEQQDPFKVLLVDDDAALVNYYTLVLEQVGMKTARVTDPLEAMGALQELGPDLILLDFHMPGCSGPELATVIRQQKACVGIPIVFLSSETNQDRQESAMLTGGDDFLTKPIHPDHLVAMVRSRARRHRVLRSLMMRDSLTGLLTHSYLKERLVVEVERARRQGTPLAYALVDIDRFKSVNDTHGHPVGDVVLGALSRLLTQRLRSTDSIGRYGGDEIAVILPSTDAPSATALMDAIRGDFGRIRHAGGEEPFTLTFSCGVAAFPGFPDPVLLNDAADRALYEAKRAGRDRVVSADRGEELTSPHGGDTLRPSKP